MSEAARSDHLERLRQDARRCIDAALAAVDARVLVRSALDEQRRFTTGRAGSVAVLAIGKAADGMTDAALTRLRSTAAFALVVAPESASAPRVEPGAAVRQRGGVAIRRITAPHPVPGPGSMNAARMTVAWLDALPPTAKLLVLLSGGASALLALPVPGLRIDELAATTRVLLASGLDIHGVNTVRKHLESTKGGRLAERVAGREVLVLAISDVVGDALDVIGSGPFHGDASTYGDALRALESAAIRDRVPDAALRVLEEGAAGARAETPEPGARCFSRVAHHVIGSGATARDAAGAAAAALGYAVTTVDEPVTGEARHAGERLVGLGREAGGTAERDVALVACGETTVTVTGDGRGGRNQELTLAAALSCEKTTDIVIASVGTDGVDGPTDAAGGIVDGLSTGRMRGAGLDPLDALRRNDAYAALDAAGDLLRTGATGTNVGDVQLVLVRQSGAGVADPA